jgi:cytochrome c oxidase subunit 2
MHPHGALDTAGPYADQIAQLFWIFVGVAAAVYAVVLGVLIHSLRRRSRVSADRVDTATPRNVIRAIGAAVILTTLILMGLGISDFVHGRALAAMPADALHIRVTANQWWWDVEYVDANPSRRVRTANELVIPVGRPVTLELTSSDVIHSFWVPALQGKKDLLPGYVTTLQLRASRAGRYTGECAEFCGFQHAHMSIDVDAKPELDYAAWYEAQIAAAPEPADEQRRRGRDVFLGSTCVMCHAVAGTEAGARLGPDLTHLASRSRIAAGTLPNDAASLAAWIADPQSIKPGTRMPATALSAEDAAMLVTYLRSLR